MVDDTASDKAKESCNVLWIDTSNVNLYLNSIKPWQRINHFPGMMNIARKTRLAENLEMMKKGFEKEFSFYPTTYILPRDLQAMKEIFGSSGKSKCTFIVKPDGGCQGRGIFLTKSLDAIEDLKSTHVAQNYVPNPLLIDGKKFDLRIYVLITSCQPLRIYLFRDGLVRLCTQDFVKPNPSNIDDKCMHLTNYAINKQSDQFEGSSDESGESGSKRSIKWFLSWLSEEKGSDTPAKLWDEIGDICVKTIISISPILVREYNAIFGVDTGIGAEISCDGDEETKVQGESKNDEPLGKPDTSVLGSRCFSILGIDIMVDSNIKPHLIEVNHLPSFATGSPLDEAIKSKVCYQALSSVKCASSDQQNHEVNQRKRTMQRLHRVVQHSVPPVPSEQPNVQGRKSSTGAHKNVEELVTEIYARHAPEKLDKVHALLRKYHGYEEWLIQRLEEKYQSSSSVAEGNEPIGHHKLESREDASSDETILNVEDTLNVDAEGTDLDDEYVVLVDHGDFDRIYPPHGKNQKETDLYLEMKEYALENDKKEQKRLTCPLWLQRRQVQDSEEECTESEYTAPGTGRGDWMFHGKKREVGPKVIHPPSQKQVEAAERLSKGYSAEDRHKTDSPCFGSTDDTFMNRRLARAEEASKQSRKRNEDKYVPKTQLQMNPINLEFVKKADR